MRPASITSFVILLFLLTAQTNFSQWQQTKGPYGAPVNTLITNGSHLFAGMEETGIWVSTDNGISWNPTNITTGRVRAFTIQNNIIFAASISTIYKSSDNGVNWTQTQIPDRIINCMASNNSLVLAGTQTYGIYISSNNGTNWAQTSLSDKSITSILINDNVILAGTQNNVYKSTDNGMNWQAGGLDTMIIRCMSDIGGTIFAGTYEDGIFKSTNNGTSWALTSQPNIGGVSSIVSLGGSIFASTGTSGIYRSTDNGSTWQSIQGTMGFYKMAILGNSLFASSPSKGVYRSSDNGTSWVQTPLINNNVTSFAGYGNFIFASIRGTTFSNGVHFTTDGGESWIYANTSAEIICSAGTNLFINGDYKVSRSTDNGTSWNSTGMGNADGWRAVIGEGNNIFASHYVIQRSLDAGETWAVLPGIGGAPVICLAVSNGLVFARIGPQSHALYRSTNNGDNWSSTGLTSNLSINSLCISGTNVFTATSTGLYISTNSGQNWNLSSLPTSNVSSVITHSNYVFASVTGSGIYISHIGSNNWQQISAGLPNNNAGSLFIHNDYLYAGILNRGIWKRALSEVLAVQNISTEIPNEYSLSQNYPNPFNPATNIKFSLPVSGFTTLNIYDASGKLVNTLVNSEMKAGVYQADFNASALASGIYFYTLSSGNFIQTNKMVLVK